MRENGKKKYHVGADIIRILAGIGVLIIHTTDPFLSYPPYYGIGGSSWWIINILNAFFRVSVPLFIILSGYLLLDRNKELDFSDFYKRRFVRIGIPAIFWFVLYFALGYHFGQIPTVYHMLQRFFTADLDHLYFIVVILELYLLTPILHTFLKHTSNRSFQILLLCTFVLTFGNALINQFYPKHAVILQKSIVTIFIPYIFYYLLGYYLKTKEISRAAMISLALIYSYATIFIAIVSGGVVASYFRQAGSITIMSMSFISFIVLIQLNRSKLFLQNKRLQSIIAYISSLVFGAYLVHMIIIMLFDAMTSLKPGFIASPMWVYVLIKTMLVIVISFAVTAIGRKIPYIRALFAF